MVTPRTSWWWWYAAAWVPLLAFYVFAYYLQGRLDGMVLASAAGNVLPDALLGVLAIHVCRRLWRGEQRRPIALVALALSFALAGSACKATLAIAIARLDGRAVDWASFDRGILLWQALFTAIAFVVIASITYARAAGARLREEAARRSAAELSRTRSELKALRAQLNPHFLFNVLHSVGAMIRASPQAAEDSLVQLGDLLRYSLRVQDAAEDGVLLGEEWEFVRTYLALEKLRLGERLRVEEEVPEAVLDRVVPAFVLQPLVENAIRHGIGARERGGTVRIRAYQAEHALHLQVGNDGPGSSNRGTGKGLELVRQRLRALYGASSSVEVDASEAGYRVTLQIPTVLES